LISFNNSTPKTSIRRKDLGDLLYMLPILCQISLPWQRGLMASIRPLNKGQGHSFWYQSIFYMRLPINCQ